VVLLAFALSAPGQAAPEPSERRRVVGLPEAGSRVSLAVDELLVIELHARPSAGYTWNLEAADTSLVALAGREHASAAGLGGADVERLVFKGLRAGAAAIALAYRRPWQKATAEDETYQVEVEVAGPYTGSYAPAARGKAPELAARYGGTAPARLNLCDPGDGSFSKCTPIKDQGSCNGCWAFATAGVFENLLQLANPSGQYSLSEQYLISCNQDNYSCSGGYPAFHLYVDEFISPETTAGAVYTSDFPYVGRDVACGRQAHPHHEKLVGFKKLPASLPTVDAIKQAILDHGPVWAGVCSDNAMTDYDGKTVFRDSCSSPNHAIVLVGWDDNGGDGYWFLRNSWGANWGDRGYMRIAFGASQVGYEMAYADYGSTTVPNQPPLADAGTAQNPPLADAGTSSTPPAATNTPPVAVVGPTQTVPPSATVTLDGSASADADGAIVRYVWTQTTGPQVVLAGADRAKAVFTAPVGSASFVFQLTVTDDAGATSSAPVVVAVDAVAASTGGGLKAATGGCSSTAGASPWWALGFVLLGAARRAARRVARRATGRSVRASGCARAHELPRLKVRGSSATASPRWRPGAPSPALRR
jgi:predicted secreted protein